MGDDCLPRVGEHVRAAPALDLVRELDLEALPRPRDRTLAVRERGRDSLAITLNEVALRLPQRRASALRIELEGPIELGDSVGAMKAIDVELAEPVGDLAVVRHPLGEGHEARARRVEVGWIVFE